MQDRYTYDIGDYAKCGLLRCLTRTSGLKLGVIWYFTDLGAKGNDGRHVAYLDRPDEFGPCDKPLFSLFEREIRLIRRQPERRRVDLFESRGALPQATVYARDQVQAGKERSAWFSKVAPKVEHAGLVFLDPDNGIASERMEQKGRRSRRHVLWNEIEELWARKKSLVLYHTCNRLGPHRAQIAALLRRLKRVCPNPRAAWFRRYSPRVFFVLAQPRHERAVQHGLTRLERNWGQVGFEII